jgi:hypothetical protein
MAARARIPTCWIVCATHRRKSLTPHDVSQAQASVQAARRGGGAQVMSLVERAAVQRLVDGLEVCMHAQPVHITTSPPPPRPHALLTSQSRARALTCLLVVATCRS